MNCPNCGKEMKAGYIGSSRRIWWDTEENENIAVMTEQGFYLTKFSFDISNVKSYHCENCELLITNLKDLDPKLLNKMREKK